MSKRAIPLLLVFVVALMAAMTGWMKPLDDALTDWRMGHLERQPTGDIVLVDIDSKSISGLGRWPWSRQVHADLIDRLIALGAGEIAFDIDFSSPTTPEDDAAFEAALEKAGGLVILAAFDQHATASAAGVPLHNNRPLGSFARHAWVAAVNVVADPDGEIRWLDYASAPSDASIPSLVAMLAGGATDQSAGFRVDYGIRADRIDRVPVIDLIEGRVAAGRIAGKKIIVGASATELRDIFHVPVHGFVSGSMVHALGAESIMQGRALQRTGMAVSLFGLLLILMLAILFSRRWGWKVMLALMATGALAVELVAVAVQRVLPLELATGAWMAALAGMMLVTLLGEIDFRRIVIAIYRNREANVQTILDRVIADNFAGVLVVDSTGSIVAASEAAAGILGTEAALIGSPVADVLPEELYAAFLTASSQRVQGQRAEQSEVAVATPGGPRYFELVVTPSWLSGGLDEEGHDRPDALVTCLTFVDTTERKLAADRIAYLARFDPTTGLANRNQFLERAATALAHSGSGRACSVMCIDLDRFKAVNDTLGHSFGDQLLGAAANRLVSMVPDGAMVARLGGTDFAVLLAGDNPESAAEAIVRKLAMPASQSYRIGERRAVVTLSIGIATGAQGDIDALTLLKQADTALHRAKEAGGSSHVVYNATMVAGLEGRRQLEIDLWDAFEKGEFEVYYQPQIDLDDGKVIGAEALMRWNHAQRGFVSPAEFVPVLESIGLMEAAGRQVLEAACRAATQWPEGIKIAVNVSSVQFTRDDLAATVADVLKRTGLPGERLELEITESLFLNQNQAVMETLDKIRAMGVHFALDDFGTGYSSLSYVQKFPIDKIKIDRSFIMGIPHDKGSVAIVRAVAAMAESLDMRMIAEGIDRDEHVSILRLLGCHEGQGFLFSKPVPEREFLRFIATRSGQDGGARKIA